MALFENGNGAAVSWRWIGMFLLAGFMVFAGATLLKLSVEVGVIAEQVKSTERRVTRIEDRLFPAGH